MKKEALALGLRGYLQPVRRQCLECDLQGKYYNLHVLRNWIKEFATPGGKNCIVSTVLSPLDCYDLPVGVLTKRVRVFPPMKGEDQYEDVPEKTDDDLTADGSQDSATPSDSEVDECLKE